MHAFGEICKTGAAKLNGYVCIEERDATFKRDGRDIYMSLAGIDFELSCKMAKEIGESLIKFSKNVESSKVAEDTIIVFDKDGVRYELKRKGECQ